MQKNERLKLKPLKRLSRKALSEKAKGQPRSRGKFSKEPGFFQRAKMVIDGSARRKIAAQKAAETRRINQRYERGESVIPRAKKTRRSRKPHAVFQPRISYYRQDVIKLLISRFKFW